VPAAPSGRGDDAITVHADHVVVRVHVRPRASSAGIAGRHGDAIAVRVAAPPVAGRANDAVGAVLAGVAGVPPAAVRLVAGPGSRAKRFEIVTSDPGAVAARLHAAIAAVERG
jgi:uncharacterized protein (TIGR00251 family)